MIKKLKRRFIAVLMILFSVLLTGISCGIYVLMYQSEQQQSDRILSNAAHLTDQARAGKGDMQPLPGMPAGEKGPDLNNMMRSIIVLRLDQDGSISSVSYQFGEAETDMAVLSAAVTEILSTGGDKGTVTMEQVAYRYQLRNTPDGQAITLLDRSIELVTLRRLILILAAIEASALLLFFIASLFLAKWLVRPTAEAWEQQRQFVADASHELKTPLTVMNANLDVVLSNPNDTVRQQSKWLEYVKAEGVRMSRLITSLLYLAKTDDQKQMQMHTPFDFSQMVTGICLAFEPVAFEKGKQLYAEIPANIQYQGNEDQCRQLVGILLDNALVHSNEHATIRLTCRLEHAGKIHLTVMNTGTPISEENRQHIFDRFFREDASRARSTGGYGLGLPIAKAIAEQHGGCISVSSGPDRNTFTVQL